jgi:aminoglycoside phosphotransferase
MDDLLAWCVSRLGPISLLSDRSKTHGGHDSSTYRLQAPIGFCYLKVHQSPAHWQNEVHAYERWTAAFGDLAPRLLAVRDETPLALLMTELPGSVMEGQQLLPAQERAIWQAAGAALPSLHDLGPGDYFGPSLRDGRPAEPLPQDASEFMSHRFGRQIAQAMGGGYVTEEELATIQAAYDLIPAFAGERPFPCHRDYCAANWLVSPDGVWMGVIDFEFAQWDVRVADFSRDPHWNWIHRPDLLTAFFAGYGQTLTPREEQQLVVARAEYALGAIVWGRDHAFYDFAQEGREALAYLKKLL